jgi:hypothetical protein
MSIALIVLGVGALYGGALLLWVRPGPDRAWIWGPVALATVGVMALLVGVAGG